MTVTYGFYDSLGGDRTYNAEQMSSIFDGIVADGVFQSVGSALAVTESTGMNVQVGTGRAWFNHTWTLNDSVLVLPVTTADLVLPRIDTVIVEVNRDSSTRANSIKIIAGTPASSPVAPTLTNAGTLHQYPLANIAVGAGVTSINSGNITNRIGAVDGTPFVTGILTTLNVSWLFAEWDSQFNTWFDNLVDQLTGEQVTNLQNQIDQLGPHPPSYKNLLINGDMSVAIRGVSATGISSGSAVRSLDRWKFSVSGLGTWTNGMSTVDVPSDFGFGRGMYFAVAVADAAPAANDYCFFEQDIEGQFLQNVKKGTAGAESLTLSFIVKSPKTGAHVVELVDTVNVRSCSRSFNVNAINTWEYKTITFPPDTTGPFTHDANIGLRVLFWLGAGSTFTSGTLQTAWGAQTNANRAVGTQNIGDTIGNYFRVSGVQLEIGDRDTGFEFTTVDRQQQRCLRYSVPFNTVASGQCVSTTGARIIYNFPVPMRAAPTIAFTTNGSVYNAAGSGVAVSSWGSLWANEYGLRISATVAGGLVAGDATSVINQVAIIDAEL